MESTSEAGESPRKERKRHESSDYEISEISPGEESSVEDHIPSSSEMQEEIEELNNSTKPTPKSRKRAAQSGPVDTFSPFHFKKDITSSFLPYVPKVWSVQNTYRIPTDVILNTIRTGGTEGLGRAELGKTVGYDSTNKSGGRRVSDWIVKCTTEHPDHIGQFQKMNGKVRTIRYFWKQNEQPERFEKLFEEFQQLTACQCPFKIGEVIKFPEKKLNTLRVSDVTLKRFNRIIALVNQFRVIVTISRLIKTICEQEMADGYKFQIDKKSVMKCLLALQTKGFVRLFDTTVRSDNINHQIQIICHGSIDNVKNVEIIAGIEEMIDSFHKEGRVFPHGQHRTLKKHNQIEENPKVADEFNEKLENVDEDLTRNRTIHDRYQFFRLQTLRNSHKENNFHETDEFNGGNSTLDDSQIEDEKTINLDEEGAENGEEDPDQAMINLFAKNPTVTTPASKLRSNQFYFGRDSLGYQNKTVRLMILHEMIYNFVHGHPIDTSPTAFDLFPPTQPYRSWEVRDDSNAYVYLEEESPYRFMPPQPQYDGVDRGWFMTLDLLAALPLSVFVLTNYVPNTIDRPLLLTYLNDPVKRHLCIGYLPDSIRDPIMKNKKIVKQLQHSFLCLAGMRLAAVGPNPSVKRFPGATSEMYYVARRVHLYDTSTSAKGYACVNPSIEEGEYVKYEYELATRHDIIMYWHHLRAIVQSTPLTYRIDDIGDRKFTQRHRQYTIGVFDRKLVEVDYITGIEELYPKVAADGVAGFDAGLFVHLKRHWDLITVPHGTVSWFIQRFRKCSTDCKRIVEQRVKSVHKDWNNFSRLSLADSDIVRTSSNPLKVEYPPIKKFGGTNAPKSNRNTQKTARQIPKKRKLDSVDIVSSSARVSVRCRFTPKERDQLIMIRAVGFFLNPVYRFWLDPTVLRDLMHEFVPESRNKTVQSLMACGVRELVRANRLAYLQRVVRNLSTFPSVLVHQMNAGQPEKILDQIPPAVLQSVLQSLRTDGLVSRSRTLEVVTELANKKDATLSF
ncbi:GTF3C1 extended winged-helix domain-containing protein [Caenorhabditis elegans]|nr:Transcription Factor ThreeC subunit (GTF3C homolog) [Caenorhabditis elegans]CDH93326.1 Transcription Factor ThreeC subunit (GTF3C homolog) [Caenorhabditis elegans]|eukprot:NP_001294529.1 Transcription Factor ThreeC subunit (GTF3C homolog) [Caenorhabditis elegans]